METELLWKYFIIILFILYLILGFCYMYFVYRSSIKKKGYNPRKLKSMRSEVHGRFVLVGVGIPVTIIIAGVLTRLLHGDFNLSNGNQAFNFFTIFLILTLPFAIFDRYQNKKKHKKFAFESKAQIVVDFNHKLLNKIANPVLELAVSIIYIGFFLYLENTYHIAFSHIIILWLLYFIIRSTKFQVKPLMKDRLVHQIFTPILEVATGITFVVFLLFLGIDYQLTIKQILFLLLLYFALRSTKFQVKSSLKSGYSYTFTFLIINQIVIIYYLVRKLLDQPEMPILELSLGLFILLALVLKSIYYLVNFGYVNKELSKVA